MLQVEGGLGLSELVEQVRGRRALFGESELCCHRHARLQDAHGENLVNRAGRGEPVEVDGEALTRGDRDLLGIRDQGRLRIEREHLGDEHIASRRHADRVVARRIREPERHFGAVGRIDDDHIGFDRGGPKNQDVTADRADRLLEIEVEREGAHLDVDVNERGRDQGGRQRRRVEPSFEQVRLQVQGVSAGRIGGGEEARSRTGRGRLTLEEDRDARESRRREVDHSARDERARRVEIEVDVVAVDSLTEDPARRDGERHFGGAGEADGDIRVVHGETVRSRAEVAEEVAGQIAVDGGDQAAGRGQQVEGGVRNRVAVGTDRTGEVLGRSRHWIHEQEVVVRRFDRAGVHNRHLERERSEQPGRSIVDPRDHREDPGGHVEVVEAGNRRGGHDEGDSLIDVDLGVGEDSVDRHLPVEVAVGRADRPVDDCGEDEDRIDFELEGTRVVGDRCDHRRRQDPFDRDPRRDLNFVLTLGDRHRVGAQRIRGACTEQSATRGSTFERGDLDTLECSDAGHDHIAGDREDVDVDLNESARLSAFLDSGRVDLNLSRSCGGGRALDFDRLHSVEATAEKDLETLPCR